ncbi:C25 family cysteine peptidase [Candidatus Oscillochloris fontis]|uniref:C25 family cysteine peptidase n=1 Tax=Candidatus Oscillochloris fontis TaxID=2496868 RepID=UPI00101BBC36|nr:C25 family cysteine peptidase [Candidatus Oscillochloris fontis]
MRLRLIPLLVMFSLVLVSTTRVDAINPPVGGVILTNDSGGVLLSWSPDVAQQALFDAGTPPPRQVVALRLPAHADATPQIQVLETRSWQGDLPVLPVPITDEGSSTLPAPGYTPPSQPTAALTILREGVLDGQYTVVYAINPIYLGSAGPTAITRIKAYVPEARLLDAAGATLNADTPPFQDLAAAPSPLANRSSWEITVTQAGIQSLSAATLSGVGVPLNDPSLLRVWFKGVEVPLELRTTSGTLTELRFYAPTPGDRYNSQDRYWLTVEGRAGPTIANVNATPSGAVACQTTALGRGEWRLNTSYESRLAGPDGNHFFVGQLSVAPAPATEDTATATFTSALPWATAPTTMTLTVHGASVYLGAHTMKVTLAGNQQTATWGGSGNTAQQFAFNTSASQAVVALVPGSVTDGVHLDSVAWESPVQLRFASKGAIFVGHSGQQCYSLSELSTGATFYDVTVPSAPVRLSAPGSSFEVNVTGAHTYLVTGSGTLHTPSIRVRPPVDLATPLNAQAVYIIPKAFVAALAPLVSHRQSQGYSVAVVETQAIYDSWSNGQVDPDAIREFLRYANDTWGTKPQAVILVGDGTADARNYLGIGQTNWIPPYLATVDDMLGETACENCFVQLNGNSPLDDWMPDLMLGRLPVKSANELTILVQKIIAYETSKAVGSWRGRAAYITDDADYAGDFPLIADESIASLPTEVKASRMYYDPSAPTDQPWRVKDSYAAFQETMRTINNGALTVTFIGHGLPYQWAYTAASSQPNVPTDIRYLLGVDYATDLRNGARLPIVLSLTCLSGQFQVPSYRGTTIDEALVLNPYGGGIATWSSTGTGVLHGHDALQRGFMRTLWADPYGAYPLIGSLTMAGYTELFTNAYCCEDALRTYTLLGDPLTPAQIEVGLYEVMLPLVVR